MKSVDVITEITVNQPVPVVADFAANPDNTTLWYKNIKSVDWLTTKPLRLGSKMAFVARFMGRKLAYVYEVVEHVPNKRFVMRTADGPFPMETTYEWESLGENKTRMTLRNKGAPKGFSRLFVPFMERMMRKENKADLAMLKEILEESH